VLAQYQAQAPACPRCQQPTIVADGTRPYALRTVFGTVRLARQRRRSRASGRIFQPLDAFLAASPGRATTGLIEAAILAAAGVEWSRGECRVGSAGGRSRTGQAAAETATQEATAVVTGERLVEPPAVPGQGLLALDGGYVQSHGNPEGMEGKVAVIASGRERVGRDRWRLTGRHYAASFGSAATFGPLVYQVAAESGVAQAESLVETHLPSPVGREFAGYGETLLNQGEVMGSGAIEKGVDLVLNRRFKGRRGMRWWRANAKAIVTLRTQILNHQAEAA
jgi:hypothetical protein